MCKWYVSENVKPNQQFREFELSYEKSPSTCRLPQRILRLWADGGIELGVCNSPFAKRFSDNLSCEKAVENG